MYSQGAGKHTFEKTYNRDEESYTNWQFLQIKPNFPTFRQFSQANSAEIAVRCLRLPGVAWGVVACLMRHVHG
jgi:hypothetical protein